ncbi:class I SAM-dependent RNA methyltransferase [Arsenicicoccus sp. oral taxon 190]|uniref:class I SAM-dependent RNA methyltransferase n=1 Tax=Arsenicicoccus sp. oral taxon 190 TaxID=1658671 RepID=UPI0009E18EC2|nr:TRAM domain-containing protein [Arsenicicoccus sp. oral taxon 190]
MSPRDDRRRAGGPRGARRPTRATRATGRPARERQPKGEPLVGHEAEVEVGAVAHGGFCVARLDGRVVFVRHALPGERVRIRVTEGGTGDRYLRADAVAVLDASPHRVDPPCPYAGPGRCGGCDWQHVAVPHQRELKAAVIHEQLDRLAGLDLQGLQVQPLPVEGRADDGLRWRTRVEFAVDEEGRAGLRRHRSHDVEVIDDCLIATPGVVASGVLRTTWPGCSSVDVVDASGLEEPVLVPVHADGTTGSDPGVLELVTFEDWQHGFEVDARGFWQVHPDAATTFLGEVVELLDPQEGEHALDLYCGVGLFAAALADAVGEQGHVLAVEADAAAVDHALDNLQEHANVEVRQGRVDAVLGQAARSGIRADVVVLDPPRSGAGRTVMQQLAQLRPRAVAYVACDPAGLARDLAVAEEHGYLLTDLIAYDAFPMTQHVECIALLEPGDADLDDLDDADLDADSDADLGPADEASPRS